MDVPNDWAAQHTSMSNTVNNIIAGIAKGFQDAVLGTLKVYKLDLAIQADIAKKSEEPMTILARRRAEKMKHKKPEKVRYGIHHGDHSHYY